MAPYIVRKVRTREHLDAVVDVIWKAQYTPYMPSSAMFFPVFGYSREAREKGKAASKERLWNDFARDPSHQSWIYVEDTSSREIVGGTLWEWYKGTEFKDGIPKPDASWWPDGEAKNFCEAMIQQILLPRTLWLHDRPSGGISHMVVHPEHRGRGVGGLMMAWGNQELDQNGTEGFLEASELGRALYEKWGYQVVMKIDFFIPPGKPDEWKRLEHEMKMPPFYALWRPPYGVAKPGERNRPWQLGGPLQVPSED